METGIENAHCNPNDQDYMTTVRILDIKERQSLENKGRAIDRVAKHEIETTHEDIDCKQLRKAISMT